MTILNTRYIIYAASLCFFLTIAAIGVNYWVYHYPGNNYFPPDTTLVTFMLILLYSGLSVQFGKTSQPVKISKELLAFFSLMALLALATNAAQYTPFPTIDKKIIAFEASLHINIETIMTLARKQPKFITLLAFLYDSLPWQMAYIPLFIIMTRRFQLIREYYFLLIVSAVIGFTFYYFFPTTAPASVITGYEFSEKQQATGLKFMQIHHHLQPTTQEGGMIALPSFHTIWAWFCLYLLKPWPVLFFIMLPVNMLLIMSCVFLGWHYVMDILGAIVVILMSHGLYFIATRQSNPGNILKNSIWGKKASGPSVCSSP